MKMSGLLYDLRYREKGIWANRWKVYVHALMMSSKLLDSPCNDQWGCCGLLLIAPASYKPLKFLPYLIIQVDRKTLFPHTSCDKLQSK